MKRPTPSFTVEIRRRSGRTASPGANFASFETKAPRAEFDRDTDRAIAAIFGPKSEVAAPVVAPPPVSTGRVLTSLVIERPLDDSLETDLSEAAREPEAIEPPTLRSRAKSTSRLKSRQGATPKTEDRQSVSRPRFVSAIESALQPQTDEDGAASAEEWIWPASRVVKTAAPKTPPAKTRKSTTRNIDLESRTPRPLSDSVDSSPAIDASLTAASMGSEVATEPRKRTIMGRYVYGDEPKPGERWKHKLRKWR